MISYTVYDILYMIAVYMCTLYYFIKISYYNYMRLKNHITRVLRKLRTEHITCSVLWQFANKELMDDQ